MIDGLRSALYRVLERSRFINDTVSSMKRSIKSRRLRSLRDFASWEHSFFSQNGEDGILRELFLRIGTSNRFFVEFGVGDGSECNTALFALEYGWSGLLIEGDTALFSKLAQRYADGGKVRVFNDFISRENILELFYRGQVPEEFDLLSIDVDGNDYWIWEEVATRYQPRIVVIEYNASIPPPKRWVMAYNAAHRWDCTTYFGASLESLSRLAQRLGYALVGTDSRGVNAFFVRRDLLQFVMLPEMTARDAYHRPRYGLLGIRHRQGSGPYEEI
jgi:hypothetical protein